MTQNYLHHNRSKYFRNSAFSINIIKLQCFDFNRIDIETAVILEWFVVKYISFGFKEFYYSQRRIQDETGVKRKKFERIISYFKDNNLLATRLSGVPPVTFYTLKFKNLTRESFLLKFYRQEYMDVILPHYVRIYKSSEDNKKEPDIDMRKSRYSPEFDRLVSEFINDTAGHIEDNKLNKINEYLKGIRKQNENDLNDETGETDVFPF